MCYSYSRPKFLHEVMTLLDCSRTTEIFGQVKDAIKQADHEISATAKREKGPSSFATIPRG